MSKFKLKKSILFIVTAIYIAFIWAHSMMSGEESSNESHSVLVFINNMLKNLNINYSFSEFFIRKAAHFTEFAILGVLVMWCNRLAYKKSFNNMLSCSFVCLFTAVVDEFIQHFTPERASMVTDVVLDFSGVLFGFIIFGIICKLKRKG